MEKPAEIKHRPKACMLGYFGYDNDARVKNYVHILIDQGYSVDIICYGKGDFSVTYDNGCTESVYSIVDREGNTEGKRAYFYNLLIFFFLSAIKLTYLHLKTPYRFIHVHNVPDPLVFTALIPKILGAKVLLDIHDILPEFYARKFGVGMNSRSITFLKFIEKISCMFSDYVIIANEVWREKVAQRSKSPERCCALINFPDMNLFKPRVPLVPVRKNEYIFTIIYHGSYTEHHGLDIALKAVNSLRGRMKNYKLVLYGGGQYETEMLKIIKELEIEDLVEMRVPVNYDAVPEILREADIGIVPKKDGVFVGDALSTKLFQYTSIGVPAVVSRTAAEKRYFAEDEVLFFNPGDHEDLARCIQRFYDNPSERLEFSQRALKRTRVYSFQENYKKYLSIINTII